MLPLLLLGTLLSPQALPPTSPIDPPPASAAEQNPIEAPVTPPESTWQSGDEPLDDMDVPPPGAIEPPLDLIERDPSNWLGIPPERELLNFIRDPLKQLDAKYGVLFTGAYTMLFQQSIGPNARSAAAGDFDLTGRWTFLGRGTKDIGSLYVAGEYRHEIGRLTPAQLGPEIGTLLGTSNGFNDRGWAVKDAYYAQRLFDDHLRFGVGRVDPENLVGATDLQSANTSFLNKAFSTNPTIAFPGAGFGAAATLRPIDSFYLSGGLTNAYGNTTQITIDELDQRRFFKFAEVGFTPSIEGFGDGKYRVAFWHLDSRSLTDQPGDGGFTIIADQKLGTEVSVFARYGYSDGELASAKQSIQAGGGFNGLFGSSSDLTGVAFGWSEPEAGGLRDEKVIEIFHRAQLTGRIQFTVGMQLIIDPSRAPDTDALGVLSARLRLTF